MTSNVVAGQEPGPVGQAAGEALPEGVERFLWSGVLWYKVGERLFSSLDKALEDLRGEERRDEHDG